MAHTRFFSELTVREMVNSDPASPKNKLPEQPELKRNENQISAPKSATPLSKSRLNPVYISEVEVKTGCRCTIS